MKICNLPILFFCLYLNILKLEGLNKYYAANNELQTLINSSAPKSTQPNWSTSVFEQKVFIENKGQFNGQNGNLTSNISYGIYNSEMQVYFTKSGLTFRQEKVEIPEEVLKEIEEEKNGNKVEETPGEFERELAEKTKYLSYYTNIDWVGANENVQIIAKDQDQAEYIFVIDNQSKNCKGFKKITYKNLYNNIDLVYTFHKEHGIKYSFILHPGADASQIKMKHSGNGFKNFSKDFNGNLKINTTLNNIIDHAPLSFYANNIKAAIKSSFVLDNKNDLVSFYLDNYNKNETVILDPWTTLVTLPSNNKALEVEKDNLGNIYVLGGGGNSKLALQKFSPAGALLWSFNTLGTGNIGYYGNDLKLDKQGDAYISTGNGPTCYWKINASGTFVWNNAVIDQMTEPYRLFFDCAGTSLYATGGLADQNKIKYFDKLTGVLTGSAVQTFNSGTNNDDLRDWVKAPNGNFYGMTIGQGGPGRLFAFNPAFSAIWNVNHGYALAYWAAGYTGHNVSSQPSSFHLISVNTNFIYTTSGSVLDKRNLVNGNIINSVAIPGGVIASNTNGNSGIVLDTCGNVYVSSNNGVYKYDSNLNLLGSAVTSGAVYDICLGTSGEILACGNGFLASLNLNACTPCATLTSTINSTPSLCGCNGSATVTPSCGVRPYSYLWSNNQTTQVAVGLCPGNYSVVITDGDCNKDTNYVTISGTPTIMPVAITTTNIACFGANNGVAALSVSGGSAPYSYSWSNSQSTATITSLTPGNYSVVVTDNNGCQSIQVCTISQPPSVLSFVSFLSTSLTICASYSNGSTQFSVTGGVPSYSYSINGGTANVSPVGSPPMVYNLSGLSVGSKTLTVTDQSGCTLTKTLIVNPIPTPVYTIAANPASCNSNNGSAVFSTTAAVNGYTWSPIGGSVAFNWANLPSTQTANNLSSNSYSFTFINGFFGGCAHTVTFQIGSIGSPTLTPSFTNAACGNATGSASVSVSPAGTYTYTWSNGQTTALANNLLPGIYTVSVKNSSNCTATQSFTIGSTPSFSINPISPVMLNCNPATQTLNASSTATGSPTYSWTGPGILSGATTSSPVINAAGNYTVTLTQGLCTNSAVVVVSSNTNVPYVSIANVNTLTCLNSSFVAIGASTTSGVSYSWTPLSVTTASALITAAGNYTLDVTHIGSGCKTSSVITVNQNTVSPNITILPTGTLSCLNTSITLTGNSTTSGASFSWSPQGVTTVSALASAAGNYTFTVTDPLNGCISNSIVAVTQNTTSPNLNVNPSTALTCLNPIATLSATSAGNTIVWNGGSLTNATNPATVNLAGTYSASATDPISGCSTTSIITVSQNTTNPNLNITPATALTCLNPSTTLTAISSGNTILWNGGSLNNATNPATVNLAGIYSVTATDPINGCTTTQTLTLNQNTTSPNVNAGLSQSITCSIPTVTLNGSSSTTGATFSWSPIGVNTATAQVNAAGNYTLTVTDPTNGCINSATTTVIASGAFPNISISPTGTLSCLNTSLTLTGSSTTSAASFSWAPQGVTTASALATTAGNYTFMVTDPLNGCTSTSVITITQNTTSPILNINPSTTLTCLNPIATLSATSAGNTIVWNGGSLTNATNPATINLAGTYSATATNPVNGCVDTQIITVNQNTTVPTLNITASATNLNCNTSSVTLTGSSNVNAGVYLWSTNVLGANNLPGAIANNAGTYSLTVTDPLNGCFNTATVGVSSAPMFSASVVVLSQINCFGNNNGALQIGVVSGGTAPFSITNLNSGSSINNIASFPIVLSNLSAANYSILVSDANGCNQTLFATITQPAALNLALGGNSTLCEGQSTTISSNVSGGSAPYAYVWSPTGGNGANLNTGTTISTNTTFSLLLTDNNGCQAQASIAIVVNPKPNATLINNKLTGCSPVCAGFSLSAIQQAGYQYSWQFTNNQSGSVTSSQLYQPDLCFKEEGSYNAGVVISSSAGCSTTVTYNNLIQVYQKPDADFSFSPTSVTMLEPLVSFTNTSSGASVYGWYNNSSNINSLFSNQANPTYVFQEPGNYLIALVATNGSCSDTALKLIEVEEEFLFYAPNAFTPNEDNLNDTWYPLVTGYKEGSFNLLLFDRWGEQLYQSNDPKAQGWDGFYKNQLCKDDVYIWKASVKDRKGKLYQFTGHVSLLK